MDENGMDIINRVGRCGSEFQKNAIIFLIMFAYPMCLFLILGMVAALTFPRG